MKKTITLSIIALMLGLAGSALAQSYSSDQGWGPVQPPSYGPDRGRGPEYGSAYRLGPGAMGDCYGWGVEYGFRGRIGRDLWVNQYARRITENCQKFLDETVQNRKDFFNKRFDYYEALRNPKTSSDVLDRMEREMSEVNQKIWAKNPHNCWWY